jgi:hypothetical protein
MATCEQERKWCGTLRPEGKQGHAIGIRGASSETSSSHPKKAMSRTPRRPKLHASRPLPPRPTGLISRMIALSISASRDGRFLQRVQRLFGWDGGDAADYSVHARARARSAQ